MWPCKLILAGLFLARAQVSNLVTRPPTIQSAKAKGGRNGPSSRAKAKPRELQLAANELKLHQNLMLICLCVLWLFLSGWQFVEAERLLAYCDCSCTNQTKPTKSNEREKTKEKENNVIKGKLSYKNHRHRQTSPAITPFHCFGNFNFHH